VEQRILSAGSGFNYDIEGDRLVLSEIERGNNIQLDRTITTFQKDSNGLWTETDQFVDDTINWRSVGGGILLRDGNLFINKKADVLIFEPMGSGWSLVNTLTADPEADHVDIEFVGDNLLVKNYFPQYSEPETRIALYSNDDSNNWVQTFSLPDDSPYQVTITDEVLLKEYGLEVAYYVPLDSDVLLVDVDNPAQIGETTVTSDEGTSENPPDQQTVASPEGSSQTSSTQPSTESGGGGIFEQMSLLLLLLVPFISHRRRVLQQT